MQRAGTTRASQGEREKAGPPARLQGAGEKNRAGRKPKGTTGRERANPSRPLQSRGAGPAAGGGKPEPPTTTTSNRGGRGWRRIGTRAQNPPRGATGRAAPGAGRHADPRSADFLRIPWRVWAPHAAHCGAGAQARRRRGPHGDAPSRPRGPPASHATAGPLAARCTGLRKAAGRARHASGLPAPDAAVGTTDTLSNADGIERPGGRMERSGIRPQRYRAGPRPRVLGGRGPGTTAHGGAGGTPPRASRPEPPRRGERGSASDSPGGPSWWGPPLLDTRTLLRH